MLYCIVLGVVVSIPSLPFHLSIFLPSGHAYDEDDPTKLKTIAQTDMDQIQAFLQLLEEQQFIPDEPFTISVGSTPSLQHHWNPAAPSSSSSDNNNSQQQWWTQFFQRYPKAILEIHPGNYTLFDRQQLYTKACPNTQAIAGRVLTRVIGHYNDADRPNTILLDAGATALTKETTPQGGMAAITGQEESAQVYRMSQEVSMARGTSEQFLKDCPLGALLTLYPNHSCLAAACFEKYYVINDPSANLAPDTPIVEQWEPVKGW